MPRNCSLGTQRLPCKASTSSPAAHQLRARVGAGESKAAIAREYQISRQTVYQYLQRKATPEDGGRQLWPFPLQHAAQRHRDRFLVGYGNTG